MTISILCNFILVFHYISDCILSFLLHYKLFKYCFFTFYLFVTYLETGNKTWTEYRWVVVAQEIEHLSINRWFDFRLLLSYVDMCLGKTLNSKFPLVSQVSCMAALPSVCEFVCDISADNLTLCHTGSLGKYMSLMCLWLFCVAL